MQHTVRLLWRLLSSHFNAMSPGVPQGSKPIDNHSRFKIHDIFLAKQEVLCKKKIHTLYLCTRKNIDITCKYHLL